MDTIYFLRLRIMFSYKRVIMVITVVYSVGFVTTDNYELSGNYR